MIQNKGLITTRCHAPLRNENSKLMTRVSFSLTIKYRNFLEKKKSIMVLKDLLGFFFLFVKAICSKRIVIISQFDWI